VYPRGTWYFFNWARKKREGRKNNRWPGGREETRTAWPLTLFERGREGSERGERNAHQIGCGSFQPKKKRREVLWAHHERPEPVFFAGRRNSTHRSR